MKQTDTGLTYAMLPARKASTREELYKRVSFAKQIIDRDIPGKTGIDSLAKESSLSKFHFIRTFQCVYGVSPHQYRLKKKMELAVQLLKDKTLSINEIAIESGFADVNSFSKFFKKTYCVSPAKFRQHLCE